MVGPPQTTTTTEEVNTVGGRGAAGIPGTGTVTLYHNTSSAAADAIVRDGFTPKYSEGTQSWYTQSEGQYGFFTRRPGVGAAGYGEAIVAVTVPKSAVERDTWSGHWKVRLTHLKGAKFRRHDKR